MTGDDKEYSKAIENIKTNYSKLTTGFPIDGLLPDLFSKNVIVDVQKETIQKEKMKNVKVSFLFDEVIIPELKIGISTKYDNLIKVMEASDDSTANSLVEVLKGKLVCLCTHVCMHMLCYVVAT